MDNINLDKLIKADEIDHNMILNVPEEIGIKIQEAIENEEIRTGEPVNIEIIQSMNDKMTLEESRKLIFKVNNILFPATIMDYPCIIEAQKTIDYKTFYKSGDICQMLYIHDHPLDTVDDIKNFEPLKCDDKIFNSLIWKNDPDHLYKVKHGLTLPTKNIRKRRFKVKKRYNKDEVAAVCKKIKYIIDNGADNFKKNLNAKGEIINDKEIKQDDESKPANFGNSSTNIINHNHSNRNGSSSKKDRRHKKEEEVKETKLIIAIPNLPVTNSNDLALKETNETKDENSEIKEKIASEFKLLKAEYDELKKQCETDKSEELHKRKKYLKKKLKAIKKEFNRLNGIRGSDEESN